VNASRDGVLHELQKELGRCMYADRVSAVHVGPKYMAVRLAGTGVGLSETAASPGAEGCLTSCVDRCSGASAQEVLGLLGSHSLFERSVGLACANALANQLRWPMSGGKELNGGDGLEHVVAGLSDEVVLVGGLHQMTGPLRAEGAHVEVYGLHRDSMDERMVEEAVAALSKAEVAILAATLLLDDSFDQLIEACRACRQVVVLGGSTPLVPHAFTGTPVTLLCGSIVRNVEAVMRVVSNAGGRKDLEPYLQKVSISLR